MTPLRAYHKRVQGARPRRAPLAKQRRLQRTRERLQREHARAPRPLWALAQALAARGVPETIAAAGPWRRHAQPPRRGQIFGRMCPPPVWRPP